MPDVHIHLPKSHPTHLSVPSRLGSLFAACPPSELFSAFGDVPELRTNPAGDKPKKERERTRRQHPYLQPPAQPAANQAAFFTSLASRTQTSIHEHSPSRPRFASLPKYNDVEVALQLPASSSCPPLRLLNPTKHSVASLSHRPACRTTRTHTSRGRPKSPATVRYVVIPGCIGKKEHCKDQAGVRHVFSRPPPLMSSTPK